MCQLICFVVQKQFLLPLVDQLLIFTLDLTEKTIPTLESEIIDNNQKTEMMRMFKTSVSMISNIIQGSNEGVLTNQLQTLMANVERVLQTIDSLQSK